MTAAWPALSHPPGNRQPGALNPGACSRVPCGPHSKSVRVPAIFPMEPDGIEPSTSCLQSRRLRVFLGIYSPFYGVLGALRSPETSRVGNTLGNTAVRLMA